MRAPKGEHVIIFYIYTVTVPLDYMLTDVSFHIIMDFVTIVTVSEAEEVPVAVLGRGRGSKQMNITQKTTEDKSEKVIRSV